MLIPLFTQVPRGLPYFSVDFGLQGGFAHVIEDQHKFPHYFGKVSSPIKSNFKSLVVQSGHFSFDGNAES